MTAAPTISWLTLLSADPELSVTFYRAMFGWRAVPVIARGGYDITAGDKTSIGYFTGLEGEMPDDSGPVPARDGGWVPFFLVTDPAPALAAAPAAVPAGKDAWLAIDNSGARFGVTTLPARLPRARLQVELATTNVNRAAAFYGALIHVTFERVEDDDMDFLAMSDADGTEPLGGIIDVGDLHRSQARPQWVPYFSAVDVDAEAVRALELGALMRIPPADSPLDRYALLADPTGVLFGLSNAEFATRLDQRRFTEHPLPGRP